MSGLESANEFKIQTLPQFTQFQIQFGTEVFELSLNYCELKSEEYLQKMDDLAEFVQTLNCFETLTYCSQVMEKMHKLGIINKYKQIQEISKIQTIVDNLIHMLLQGKIDVEIAKCQNPSDLIVFFGKMKKATHSDLFPIIQRFFWHKAESKINVFLWNYTSCDFASFEILLSWLCRTYPRIKNKFEDLLQNYVQNSSNSFEKIEITKFGLKIWQNGFVISNLQEYFNNTNLEEKNKDKTNTDLEENVKDKTVQQFVDLKMLFYKILTNRN